MRAKNNRWEAAIQYSTRGWYVLPVYSEVAAHACPELRASRKAPTHPAWVKDATINPARMQKLWNDWPDANGAIATGTASDIFVIDVDPRNGGVKTLKTLESVHGSLRDTTTAKTGGDGRHFIFRHPGFRVQKNALGQGIDVLSDGQYIIVSPSLHVSGRVYSWLAGHDPDQKPPQPLPVTYHGLLRRPDVTRVAGLAGPNTSGTVTEGRRNTTLTSRGGKLLRSGISEAAIRAALVTENASFQPPLDHAEVERIVVSLLRYSAAPGAGIDDPSLEFVERVLAADFAGGDHLMFVSGTFWRYNGRHWCGTSDKFIQQCVVNAIRAGGAPKGYRPNSFSNDIVSLLKARTLREDDPLRFLIAPLPVINCRNGELWLADTANATLTPHSAPSVLHHCLDINYDPSATCQSTTERY
jgi:hypothetical protein